MTDAEKKPCCAAEPAEKDTALSCCRHKDRTPEEYRALANRLSRIEGQVRGIHTMLDKDVYCADILVQVAAVNAALNGFSKELLSQHVRTCVADDLRAGGTQKLDELLQLLPRLTEMDPVPGILSEGKESAMEQYNVTGMSCAACSARVERP